MRNLPNHMQSSEVAYIDLSKPSQPAITLNKASVPESDLGENSQE
jgi:hypothetical protein